MSLRSPNLPSKIRERLTTIDRQAKRATDLIQQILDFSRRAVLERQPLNLQPFLSEQVKLLERTLPENIRINMVYGSDDYVINADPTRMQQVLMNLALNARDAMPTGGNLRIELKRLHIQPGEMVSSTGMETGEWVQVKVSDTGTGIPPDLIPRVFEPFFTTKAPLGSGLGLAQVYGIVKQHNGHIDVESQVGEGTTFTLYIPALPLSQQEAPTQPESALLQGQGQTILVVEDDATTLGALAESLKVLNYHVLEASNGQEALAVFEGQDDIDLVLSDVVMPDMDGVGLLQALQERDPALQIVMLTGHPLEDTIEHIKSDSVADWLQKPVSLEQLAQVVGRVLGVG